MKHKSLILLLIKIYGCTYMQYLLSASSNATTTDAELSVTRKEVYNS
jgi:hypothetical protein